MTPAKIAIILSTTRATRFADRPAQWILDLARQKGGADYEIVDLRDYPLPFYDEAVSPAYGEITRPEAQRWAARLAEFDGYIFVTAEYNHSISGVLKNALDYVYPELNRKPAAFVGYGGVGAARAIEQLRLILIELQMAPLKPAVHMGMIEYLGLLREGKDFSDFPHLAAGAEAMLSDLLWWTQALKIARQSEAAAPA